MFKPRFQRYIFASLIVLSMLFAITPAQSEMTTAKFEAAAAQQFATAHRAYSSVPTGANREFAPNLDFPTSLPDTSNLPWADIDPMTRPADYMDAVLGAAYDDCGSTGIDWDARECGWYHAPWFHGKREYMRGLTIERSSRPGELYPDQTTSWTNVAVGIYNDVGGYGFHRIWADTARPKTRDFVFDVGTATVKLLFTTATEAEVPYLKYAKQWRAVINNRVQTVRILQLDIAVRDERVDDFTGWIFGTYVYNGETPVDNNCNGSVACERTFWRQRMQPVGLHWGNDPDLTRAEYNNGDRPKEGWINPEVKQMFRDIRTASNLRPYLGRYERMNGPVDNPQSACLACHGRAVDYGRAYGTRSGDRFIPFTANWNASAATERHFFRNLKPNQPFKVGTQSLDYSLQASIGLQEFRKWVETQDISGELLAETRDITPIGEESLFVNVMQFMGVMESDMELLPSEIVNEPNNFSRGN